MPLDSRLLTAEPIASAPGWSARPGRTEKFKLRRGYEPVPGPSAGFVGVGQSRPEEEREVALQDPAKALLFAHTQIGRPYSGPLSRIGGGRFGDPGYDCSSFVSAAYRELGIQLTPFTDAAARQTQQISRDQARAGDLVFYRYADPSQPGVAYPHMGIYLGNGQMIDAGYTTGVSVRPLLNQPYEIRRAPGVNPTQVVYAAADQAQIATASPSADAAPPPPPITVPASPNNFLERMLPYAQQVQAETGIPASIMLGIAANETGYGRAVGGNNLFGIKGRNPDTGASFNSPTWEVVNGQRVNTRDTFRSYESPEESFRDFARFLRDNPRYREALTQTDNPEGFIRAVHRAGYATDPNWSNQVLAIARQIGTVPNAASRTAQPPAPAARPTPPPAPEPWRPSPDAPGWEAAARGYERQFGVARPEAERAVRTPASDEELGWREAALGMVAAGQPFTAPQDYFAAADRYQREFGEELDWNQYFEDPGTYGYVEQAMGMSRDNTPEGEWAPEPWVEPWEEEEEDLGWGQDVGVGADGDWWEWGPFDEIGQFGRGAVDFFGNVLSGGGPMQEEFLSREEEERRRRELQQLYGWGNPIEHIGRRFQDATLGQAAPYETPILGGLARAGGLGLNLASDVLQAPVEAFQYGMGVARGLGDVIGGAPFGDAFGRQGEWETRDWGNLGGVRSAPRPRNLGDIFDPAQAQARYETQTPPFTQAITEIGLGSRGLGAAGAEARSQRIAQETAGRLQTLAETGSWLNRMDVPTPFGLQEDLGNLVMNNLTELGAQTVFPTLGAIGGAVAGASLAHDPTDTEITWPEYARNMAIGGGLGAVAGLVGWKSANMAATHLTKGAHDYRILNYGEDMPDSKDEFEELLRKRFPQEYEVADPMGRSELIERIHKEAAERYQMPVVLEDARGAVGTYPYLQEQFDRFRQSWVDRFAVFGELENNFGGFMASISDRALDDVKKDLSLNNLVRAAANIAPTASNWYGLNVLSMLHQKGVRTGDQLGDFHRYFNGAAVGLDRALGTMSDDALELAALDPDTLRKIGIDDRYITDALQTRNRVDTLTAQWDDARQEADLGQLVLAGPGEETRAGTQMLSKLAPLEDELAKARDAFDLARGTLEARVELAGGVPPRADRVTDILQRIIRGDTTLERTLGVDEIGAFTRLTGKAAPDEIETIRRVRGGREPIDTYAREGAELPLERPGRPAGFEATGPRLQTLPEAMSNFASVVKMVENKYGPGRAADWLEGSLEMQRRIRPLLDAHEAAGGLAPGSVEKLVREHGIYGAIRAIEENVDHMRANGFNTSSLVVDDKVIKNAYSTDSLVAFSEEGDYKHVEKIMAATAKLDVFNELKRFREMDPTGDFGRSIMRPFVDGEGNFKPPPVGPTKDLPPGWGYYTGYNKGALETYLMPSEIRDTLMGTTPNELNHMLQILGRVTFAQPFRLGVTVASMPFVTSNIFRDFQTGIQNSKYPLSFLRNYLSGALDVASHGLDQFIAENRGNTYVESLPAGIHKSFENIFSEGLGPVADAVRQQANRAIANKLGDLSETGAAQRAAKGIWGDLGRQSAGFLQSGGVTSALTPQMTGYEDAARTMGYATGKGMPVLGGIGHVIRTPVDLMSAVALTAELTGRVAVYRSMLEHGEHAASASMAARSVLTDFSKGGQWAKTLSVLFPLVNARLQGSLRSAEAATSDPEGFAVRLTMGAAVPSMALYAYNRMLFSDAYDGIPQYEKDKNWIVVYGTLRDDRDAQGKDRALYFKIPKNEVAAMVANPIEHVMDAKFHVMHGKRHLEEDERTERSAGQMWLTQVASMLPIAVAPQDLGSASGWFNAAISAQPAVGTYFQLAQNFDQFRQRPIVPDEQLLVAKEFQRGSDGRESPWAAKLLSRWLKDLNVPEGFQLSPPEITFAVSHLGGTAASQVLYAPDLVWEKFAEKGLPVPDQMKPTRLEDLGLPPGVDAKTAELYLNGLQQADIRPWPVKFISRLFGMGGNGGTPSEKVKTLSQAEQKVWKQTTEYERALELARYQVNQDKEKVIADESLTMREKYDRLDALSKDLVGRQNQLAAEPRFEFALRDPASRKAFVDALPGVPIDVDAFRPSTLPDSVQVSGLVSRYQNPPGVDMTALNPLAQQQAKSQELRKMARELDVPTAVLRDYIAADLLNNEIPSIPVPAPYLDEVVNRYMRPPGEYDNRDMREVSLRRRIEIQKASGELGVSQEDLLERVNVRLLSLQHTSPVALSREHAMALRSEVMDPTKFPMFADNQGNPVGMEQEWEGWRKELDYVKSVYPGEPWRWPEHIRAYDMAKANADIKRQQALVADPHYYDYQAWFGMGQDMTSQQWQKFITGEMPRYTDNPGTAESARRDGVVRQYNMLPSTHPVKAQVRFEAQRYKQLQVPGWRQAMLLDDMGNRMQDLDELYAQLQGGAF